jgi:gluconolactonase
MKNRKLLLNTFLLLGFGFIGIHAQDSHTDVIPVGSIVNKLSSNQYSFTEGPVWYRDSVLLFTNGSIYSYDPVGNQFKTWPNNSGGCNGLTCDKAGNILGCSNNVVMMNQAGKVIQTLAGTYNDKNFNGPNDLIADDKGGVYFSDPVFFDTPIQDKTAVYYIDSAGTVKRVIDDLAKPNGLGLSPDGKKLYVVDFDSIYVYSWDVAPDGSISGKSKLAELQDTGIITPGADGMAIDIYGNIYIATLLEEVIQIFSPKGAFITTITLPEGPSNCDFGGKDFKTLYITARKNLYSIDLNYPGYSVSGSVFTSARNSIPDKPLVEIYPNPVQNLLYIDLSGHTGMLEAFDITGKSLLQKEFRENNTSIDVSGLENGIYFVKVWLDNQMFTGKFVKQ